MDAWLVACVVAVTSVIVPGIVYCLPCKTSVRMRFGKSN